MFLEIVLVEGEAVFYASLEHEKRNEWGSEQLVGGAYAD